MSADNLIENGPKTIVYEGYKITVDTRKVSSFKACCLLAKINGSGLSDFDKFLVMVDYLEFILGEQLYGLVDHLGGDIATTESVAKAFAAIIEEANSKN